MPLASTADQIRQITATMLDGTGLDVEERRCELIVTNPVDPERGQVCIALADGAVCWERTETDYWDHLDGTPASDPGEHPVTATTIIRALVALNSKR
jgi:hypothetical protein